MTEELDGRRVTAQAALVAQSFVGLADSLVDDFDVVELLDRLVADCVELLEVSAAGIMLLNRDRTLDVMASSDEASRTVEVFQLQSHSGPSIDVVRTGTPVSHVDVESLKRRWPAFGHAVEDAGFSAVHALPMRLRRDKLGALSLVTTTEPALSEADLRLAQAMADVATIAILQQRALSRASVLTEQLQLALNTRIVVEQAKGVISEFGGVDMGHAFDALRVYARDQRLKLSAVAHAVVSRQLDPARVIERRPPP